MGFKIKGLKKVFKNFTHSKLYKSLPGTRQSAKLRKKLGLTGHRARKIARMLKDMYAPKILGSSSLNSAGAVIPSTLNRSVTDLY